jgi:hypothetical protein
MNLKSIVIALGIFLLNSSTYAQWTQLGIDIDGEAASDYSGISVSSSADGLTVAIGAYQNDDSGSNAGQVRIYKMIAGVWIQQGGDIDGEAANDGSGHSVSLSADGLSIAIGARGNDGNGSGAGHVRVYKLIAGVWTQQGGDIDGEAVSDGSGYSLDMSSDGLTVVIGAWFNDGTAVDAGHARVYKLNAGVWTQLGADIDGTIVNGYAGTSVSISADGLTVAIGQPGGFSAGRVGVYKYIAGVWTLLGTEILGEAIGDYAGVAVSLNSDGLTVAIGAEANNGNGSVAGHVRVYKFIGGVWTQQGMDLDGEAAGDQSGSAVSLSSDGSTVAISATNNGGNGPISGHVRVYKFIGGVWIQQDLDIDGEAANDYSGKSICLSSNGHTIIIGAYQNDGNGAESGHARVYSNCIPTSGTDVLTKCDNYTWIDGNTYTASNNLAQWTLTNAAGCDSVVTLNLTINPLPDNNVTQSGALLTADQTGATYQWLDCDDNNSIISGETNQSYTPTLTGNYAVEVTMNGCVDTSSCFLVDYSGIEELSTGTKELVKIVDLMGRETTPQKNMILIYIYSDGTTERIFEFE